MTNKYFKKVKEDKLNYKNTVVNQIFSSVSKKYDLMNDLMSFGFHTSWKNKVAEILDVDKKKNLRFGIRVWRYNLYFKRKLQL